MEGSIKDLSKIRLERAEEMLASALMILMIRPIALRL